MILFLAHEGSLSMFAHRFARKEEASVAWGYQTVQHAIKQIIKEYSTV